MDYISKFGSIGKPSPIKYGFWGHEKKEKVYRVKILTYTFKYYFSLLMDKVQII